MPSLVNRVTNSPTLVRVVPFVIFVAITAGQGAFGEASRYWLYALKTVLGAAMLVVVWPHIKEMRWAFGWEAVVVGVAVFLIWVGLDGLYPSMDSILGPVLKATGLAKGEVSTKTVWNPHEQFGSGSAAAWFFIGVRLIGSTLVVPPLEEVFYRSFLYRYVSNPSFLAAPLHQFIWKPFLVVALVFGIAHHEWLPAILCGCAYQGLVVWKKRLGDAMLAHAITNFLLGLWVIQRGAWHFW